MRTSQTSEMVDSIHAKYDMVMAQYGLYEGTTSISHRILNSSHIAEEVRKPCSAMVRDELAL